MYKTTSRQYRIDQAKSELKVNIEGASNTLSASNINVLATVIGATAFDLEQYIKYAAEQAMLLTTSEENLEEIHGKLWKVPSNLATAFEGVVEFTGLDNSIIPIGTEVQSSNGHLYLTTAEAIISNLKALVSVKSSNVGVDSNLTVNSEVSLTESIEGLTDKAIVKNIEVPGQNAEDPEDYRLRIQEYINNRNNTGTLADYELWAKQVTGVKQAYARRNINGAGTVGLYVVSDSDLTELVEEHISLLKPVSAELFVIKPANELIDLNIKIKPFSNAIEAKIRDSISSYFKSLDFEESIVATQLNKAISDNPEVEDFQSNAININIASGHTATLGNLVIESLSNE